MGAEEKFGVSCPDTGLWPHWQKFPRVGSPYLLPFSLRCQYNFPGDGHESPLARGDICFQRGEHCARGDDRKYGTHDSWPTIMGGTLKHNQHPTTITQAGRADLLPLNCLYREEINSSCWDDQKKTEGQELN